MAAAAMLRAVRSRAAPGQAAAALGVACFTGLQLRSPLSLEERPAYSPPPRFEKSFDRVKTLPADKAGQLAWAVKNLEADKLQELLSEWPEGAKLIDCNDNTLFHLAASQSSRCRARPTEAQKVMSMLLRDGWDVVDMKNQDGQRAELVAEHVDPKGPARQLLRSRSQDYLETLRAEEPLPLVKDDSPVPWLWDYVLEDEQRRSYAGVVKRAVDPETCARWMKQAITKGAWCNLPGVPRKVAWYVSQDCADCPYRYSGLEYPATVFPDFMQEIREEVCRVCGIPSEDAPNSCNVNIYSDHSQEVGWHSDDEVMFQGLAGDTRILSFSLGTARDFSWRLQGTTETIGTCSLGDGDIMTMEGLFQKHYKHSVPKSESTCGTRLNFTFRWIKVKAHAADAGTKGVA